jgi:regulatory protein
MGVGRKGRLETETELYQYAIATLARRMRSVAELKRLLRSRVESETEIGQTLVELVVRRLKDQGYLNDASYAAAYSRFRRENQKFGPRRVITDLKAKGVHGEVIQAAIDATFAGVNEERLAREHMRRKRIGKPENNKDAARIVRQLIRAGFSSSTTFKILRNWKLQEEFLEELENEVDRRDF